MGGFYRIDIGEHLAVLNLNSLYMTCRNTADLQNFNQQVDWLKGQLS